MFSVFQLFSLVEFSQAILCLPEKMSLYNFTFLRRYSYQKMIFLKIIHPWNLIIKFHLAKHGTELLPDNVLNYFMTLVSKISFFFIFSERLKLS